MKNASKLFIAGTSTNASQLTAEIDTKGFTYAKIFFWANTTGAPSTNSNNIVETDTSGSTNTNAITGLVQGTDYTLSTTTNSTQVAKVVYGVPLSGRKRYLKVTATCATTGIYMIGAELSDPADTISVRKTGTAATDGAGSVVNL